MRRELKTQADPVSGIEVTQLTDYRGHSHHLYFTNPGWYDDGKKLLFASDRENRRNLFGLDLKSGDIEQLTDLDEHYRSFLSVCVNPVRPEAYYRDREGFYALDLHTGKSRQIYHIDGDWRLHMSNCDASGEYVYVGIFHDPHKLSEQGFTTFVQMWESRPLSRIVQIACQTGESRVIYEKDCWTGHLNTSPTRPELISFCYEGPWDKVGQRIWIMNVVTGKIHPLRPVTGEEMIGHEYWYADGEHIGYHGHKRPGLAMLGFIRYDNTDQCDTDFPTGGNTGHIFSLDDQLIVGDGDGLIKCWRREGDGYSKPRIICSHDSGLRFQITHPHPRISPDGRSIIFTSDRTSYGNLYRVPVPPFEELEEYVQP
ncbi:oligogalacturonate lyase family protein [Ruficoccus sp. ZRK36]|uniref:oligogalacturonate lyase family protein n=1 Tax=Ruficoccus sp. ZRK36 TaxID=2866311 RepID=UPI001C738BE4|nr:oligogalacturonate lyase family protein [Ruficoccus sp. ZRK36]QYY37402.1 oligogalacturonate lyase family protein [Ruficoccus sp. ZRK36]